MRRLIGILGLATDRIIHHQEVLQTAEPVKGNFAGLLRALLPEITKHVEG